MFKATLTIILKGIGTLFALVVLAILCIEGWTHDLLFFLIPSVTFHLLAFCLLNRKIISFAHELKAFGFCIGVCALGSLVLFGIYMTYILIPFDFSKKIGDLRISDIFHIFIYIFLIVVTSSFIMKLEKVADSFVWQWFYSANNENF